MMFANSTKMLVCALAMLASVAVVRGQDASAAQAQLQNMQAQLQSNTQSGLARMKSMFSMEPMVDTGNSPLGGRKVNVHVPGFFDLKLDTRANNGGMRMSQTVLSGLVNIYMDRTRDATTGRLSGPISVKVGGLTMYQNEEARTMGSVPTPAV